MNKLGLYRAVSSVLKIRYRSKIMLAAFAGTYAPLLAVILFLLHRGSAAGMIGSSTIAIVLMGTLTAAFLTLKLIDHLLQPVLLTTISLKRYAREGILPDLPTRFTDEAGTLMADAQNAVLTFDSSLRRLADHDPVTALPNRDVFMRQLNSTSTAEQGIALCAMSLTNYDKVAAAFGQSAVNDVIVGLAARFKTLLGEEAPLSRIGANTFIFALPIASNESAANEAKLAEEEFAGRIEVLRGDAEKELVLPGLSFRPEINAGVSLHTIGAIDAERLINEAISAMAGAHVDSPFHIHFFSPRQNEQARDIFMLERDIRVAIDQEQFSVHYQPIVDTALGRVVGAEALVRWSHPERGMVAPVSFIPVAEASGLMDAIGMRVLQQVCRQLGRWGGTSLGEIKVSINLSARQFLNPDAVLQIREALEANNVSPRNLEIELTETTVIQDTQRTLVILQVLRQMGITIAIDDFGTGYSGLSYLKTLPFDRLKIDREFIQNVDQTVTSKAICKSLIELASGLGIEVLAEGTETAAEVGMMRSLGCGLYQGYHFARPLPADKFLEAVQLIEERLSHQLPVDIQRSGFTLLDARLEAEFEARMEAELEARIEARIENQGHAELAATADRLTA